MSLSMAPKRIVIVGAGQAGARAAESLRSSGFTGSIALIGEEPHLPYERPQLSKEILLKPDSAVAFIRSAEQWAEVGVDLHLGAPVVGADYEKNVVGLADGREFMFDQLLIATGTRPRRLVEIERGPTPVQYLRGIEDAVALRSRLVPQQRLVLVGGGVIGLEVAAAAAVCGCHVTVVEAAPCFMLHIGSKTLSRRLESLHHSHGIEIRYGVTVANNIEGGVELSDGTRLAADCLIVGVGVEPAVELGRSLGLATEQGIRVQDDGCSEIPGIYAAGDVALQFSRWHDRWMRIENYANAQNQASAIATVMLGGKYAAQAAPWFWSDQYGINIQVVGNPGTGDEIVRGGDADAERLTVVSMRDDELVGAITLNNARDMAALRRLVTSGARVARADLENPATDLRRIVSN